MDQRVIELLFDIVHMSDIKSVPPRISASVRYFLLQIKCSRSSSHQEKRITVGDEHISRETGHLKII